MGAKQLCHDCRNKDANIRDMHAQRSNDSAEIERLRTVLRSLISTGGASPIIKAMAMNTLEPGSGDKWLEDRT